MRAERSTESIKIGFDLRELRAVLAVAELGSFRRAAAELGYTQSALSHQVASLEKALGWSLFHRPGGRGQVRLTPAGEAVCRRARRAMAEVEAIAADAEEAERGESIRVRVGVSQTAAAEIMPQALRAFREAHPAAEVILTEFDDSADVAHMLRQGQLDLAFAVNPAPHEFLETVHVLEDSWAILTRRDSAIAQLERPEFESLDGLDLVAWTHRWRGQAELERAWAERGIAPRIVYRTDDNLALQRLVAAGLGHACIGGLAARRAVDPSLTWLPLRERLVPREIGLCYPRHRPMTATSLALIAAIRAQAAAL
jgi:DNA-binding transcriptional LysR family regulator